MMTLRAVVLVAMLVSGLHAHAGDDPDTARFRALEESWASAIASQDRAQVEPFLAPEYTLTVGVGDRLLTFERSAWLKNATSTYVLHEFHFGDMKVRKYGNTAVVTSSYTQKATVNGGDRSGTFVLTDIWVKRGGKWLVSARYSSRPEPARR